MIFLLFFQGFHTDCTAEMPEITQTAPKVSYLPYVEDDTKVPLDRVEEPAAQLLIGTLSIWAQAQIATASNHSLSLIAPLSKKKKNLPPFSNNAQ